MKSINEKRFPVGTKVTYAPTGEKGIVKSHRNDGQFVHVVYNCGNDWKHYQDYTAAATPISQLIKGW